MDCIETENRDRKCSRVKYHGVIEKEVMKMPVLKNLLDELKCLKADPRDVWLPGQL